MSDVMDVAKDVAKQVQDRRFSLHARSSTCIHYRIAGSHFLRPSMKKERPSRFFFKKIVFFYIYKKKKERRFPKKSSVNLLSP